MKHKFVYNKKHKTRKGRKIARKRMLNRLRAIYRMVDQIAAIAEMIVCQYLQNPTTPPPK